MASARYDSYVICTSPRSGSTLLCKLLRATGVAGNPASYFHQPCVSDWAAGVGLSSENAAAEPETLAAIFQAVIAQGQLETGMFGLRLQRHSFDFFTQKLAVLHPSQSSDVQRLHAAFGRVLFVFLSRRDKVEQAVSYVRAQQTGLWHVAPDGTELERLSPPQNPVYDGREIRACFETMTAHDRDWEDWFQRQGIDPLRITYEALAADPVEGLRQVLDRLGLDRGAATGITPGVKKLADDVSRDWVARFKSEARIA